MGSTLRNSKDFWTEAEHASGDFFSALSFIGVEHQVIAGTFHFLTLKQ